MMNTIKNRKGGSSLIILSQVIRYVIPIIIIIALLMYETGHKVLLNYVIITGVILILAGIIMDIVLKTRNITKSYGQEEVMIDKGVQKGIPSRLSGNDQIAIKAMLTVILITAIASTIYGLALWLFLTYYDNNLTTAIVTSLSSPIIFLMGLFTADAMLRLINKLTGYLSYLFNEDSWLIRVNAPLGMVIGSLTFARVIVGGDGDIYELIYNHELTHYNDKANAKLWVVFSLLTIPMSLIVFTIIKFRSNLFIYVITMSTVLLLAITAFIIMMLRVFEVHADYGAYKAMGPRAWDAYLRLKGMMLASFPHPIRELRELYSRITHTGRRDLVLVYGDPIAPHAPWEFPLVFGLLSSAPLYVFSVALLDRGLLGKVPGWFLSDYLPPVVAVTSILTSFVVIFLLGLIIRPIIRAIAKPQLLSRGLMNLSTLVSGIYILSVASSAASLLISPTPPTSSMPWASW